MTHKIYKVSGDSYKILFSILFVFSFFYHQKGFSTNFKVSVVLDGNETVSKKSTKVKKGSKANFTLKAKKGYIFSKLVAGTCPTGKWAKNTYTTGKITKNCKLFFSAGRVGSRLVIATPSGDSNVTIVPNSREKIITGTLAQFKVTPKNQGGTVSRSVGGTCPTGVWLDISTYKIGPIVNSCSVTFTGTQGSGGGGNLQAHLPYLKWVDSSNNIYILDSGNDLVRKVDGVSQIISTIAGVLAGNGYSGDGGPATQATFYFPLYAVADNNGDLYISDTNNQVIRKITHSTGIISTIAGNNALGNGLSGDGGAATQAQFYNPSGIALDTLKNVYIADFENGRIRKVDANTGIMTTVAGNGPGNGAGGYSGDGGPATLALIGNPRGVAIDALGNMYIADDTGYNIRYVDATTGNISTIAGVYPTSGTSGDGGPATQALLNSVRDIALDGSGNLYILDLADSAVRVIDTSGNINLFAGNYSSGYSGDLGPATAATLTTPTQIAADTDGNLFIMDGGSHVIRKVTVGTGIITTVAGNGSAGFSGDGGPATLAQLNSPF